MKTENILYFALAAAGLAGAGYVVYKNKDKIATLVPTISTNTGIVPLIASSPAPLIPSTPTPPLIPSTPVPPLVQSSPAPVQNPVTVTTPPPATGLKDAAGNTFVISTIPYDSLRNWILVNGAKNGAGINLKIVNGVAQINNGLVGDNSIYLFQSGKWVKQVVPISTPVKTTTVITTKPGLASGLGSLSALLR
jgi:hypothetical protein